MTHALSLSLDPFLRCTLRTALRALAKLLALLALFAISPTPARAQRDPTRPPEIINPVAVREGGASAPAAHSARQLMVVNGRRYVVEGTRFRGVGDKLGEARIERIEDAAVVVRDAAGTHRLPLYAGVSKRAVAQDRPTGPNSR